MFCQGFNSINSINSMNSTTVAKFVSSVWPARFTPGPWLKIYKFSVLVESSVPATCSSFSC